RCRRCIRTVAWPAAVPPTPPAAGRWRWRSGARHGRRSWSENLSGGRRAVQAAARAPASSYHAAVVAPSKLIRWLLFALLAAAVGGGLLLALLTVDTALSIWQRLQALPAGFRYLYIAVMSLAAVLIASLGWRLLRRRRS